MQAQWWRVVTVWLPKDERLLIEAYYLRIGAVAQDMWFEASGLAPVLAKRRRARDPRAIPEYGDAIEGTRAEESFGEPEQQIKRYIDVCHRIEVANATLQERGLIQLRKHDSEHDVFGITLTVSGYDLGRQYGCWFSRSGAWFEQYRNHWLWLFVGFLGGLAASLLVELLKGIGGKP